MRITAIKSHIVHCFRTNWVFVSIHTDEGFTGYGEATLEYREQTVATAIHELERYLVGKDPTRIEQHTHHITRDAYWRGGPVLMSALSGIEMALWDISARALDAPVYRLLGGKFHERVRVYANGWFDGARKPEEFASAAKAAVAHGFTALKWDPFGSAYRGISHDVLDQAVACVGAVREAVGNGVDLMIEGHGRFDVPAALQIARELAPFKPTWFEEPVMPENITALAAVREKSPIPIAAGERLYGRQGFRELFARRAVDYVQPDVSHAGGILECRKIAAQAETEYVSFAPHNPSGPIATAATLQIAACTPNFTFLEIMATDVPWRRDISDEQLDFEDGFMRIPGRPGLGVALRREALPAHPYQPRDLRHYDGTLTDIRPPDSTPYF